MGHFCSAFVDKRSEMLNPLEPAVPAFANRSNRAQRLLMLLLLQAPSVYAHNSKVLSAFASLHNFLRINNNNNDSRSLHNVT